MKLLDRLFRRRREAKEQDREFAVGGYGEESEWYLAYNVEVYRPKHLCSHAVVSPDGTVIVPRVVIAFTQGGYDLTRVCLDCILEAAKKGAK